MVKERRGLYPELLGKKATYFNLFQATYTLNVGGFTGNAGDSLVYHNGQRFSTFDRDNDSDDSWYYNCAKEFKGAWW